MENRALVENSADSADLDPRERGYPGSPIAAAMAIFRGEGFCLPSLYWDILIVGGWSQLPRAQQKAAERLAGHKSFNTNYGRAGVPLWLRVEAVKSLIAFSNGGRTRDGKIYKASEILGLIPGRPIVEEIVRADNVPYVPYNPGPGWPVPALWRKIVAPMAAPGTRRAARAVPIRPVIPWRLSWRAYVHGWLAPRMREVFRVDDFDPPPMWMHSKAPGELKSLDYPKKDEDDSFGNFLPDLSRGTTAGDALLNIFLSELSATDRFIYLACTEGKATPKDLAEYLRQPADRLRKRRDRLYQLAEASLSSAILESSVFGPCQSDHRLGLYSEDTPELYGRLMAQHQEQRGWGEGGPRYRQGGRWQGEFHGVARAYGRATAAEIVKTWARTHGGPPRFIEKGKIYPNSTLGRHGGAKSLYELKRAYYDRRAIEAFFEKNSLDDQEAAPWQSDGQRDFWKSPILLGMHEAVIERDDPPGDDLRLFVEGSGSRAWAPLRGTTNPKGWDEPAEDSDTNAPSREFKPRCLEPDCTKQVATLYESRAVPPENALTKPVRIPKAKEKTDANRYCKRHLRDREEMTEVTVTQAAEIAASIHRLEDRFDEQVEETREAISSMLTALTWKFPQDEELMDAVESWRRDIGEHGVQVLAD